MCRVTHNTSDSPAASPLDDAPEVLAELGARVDELVGGAGESGWRAATPAEGWDVATQVAHLHWTDDASSAAIANGEAFAALVAGASADPESFVDTGARALAALPREDLLARWRAGRDGLAAELEGLDPGTRITWFGPPMRPKSMATARIMETFAHGYDIADGLAGVPPHAPIAERAPGLLGTGAEVAALPFVARIGHRTRDFAYAMNGEEPPTEEFRLALTAPDGSELVFGPADATQSVEGPLRDLCLRVTQRVALADTALVARGDDARHWLELAQAFAGLPGAGRDER